MTFSFDLPHTGIPLSPIRLDAFSTPWEDEAVFSLGTFFPPPSGFGFVSLRTSLPPWLRNSFPYGQAVFPFPHSDLESFFLSCFSLKGTLSVRLSPWFPLYSPSLLEQNRIESVRIGAVPSSYHLFFFCDSSFFLIDSLLLPLEIRPYLLPFFSPECVKPDPHRRSFLPRTFFFFSLFPLLM